jgi:pantoate--beta-alanine ligase
MKVIDKIDKIREELDGKENVGLVPTMGYLHNGHLSLVEKALNENEIVVVSIFVNPAQFSPGEDFEEYPRDMKRDKEILTDMEVDYIFNPDVEEMYEEGYNTYVEVEELSDPLCGVSRPCFFRGITTVVSKLFNIIQPDRAYFGLKDYQQYVIVNRMVNDLNFSVEIKGVPIVREEDGLAMSSRNRYLNKKEREAATILYRSLNKGKKLIEQGERDAEKIEDIMINMIKEEELARIDYVKVVNPDNLQTIETINNKVLMAEAVFIGETRLVDNMIIDSKKG